MLLQFTPKARDFKVGERVIIVTMADDQGRGASLSGMHYVERITKTSYWVHVEHYKAPVRFVRETCAYPSNMGGIMQVNEAAQQGQALQRGEHKPWSSDPACRLCIGHGSL